MFFLNIGIVYYSQRVFPPELKVLGTQIMQVVLLSIHELS